MNRNLYLGIDIGTTTIGITVTDGDSGEQLIWNTQPNFCDVCCGDDFAKVQNPDAIVKKVLSAAKDMTDKYKDIKAIGLSGQMHGILYVDKHGNAVSDLYTWQDERGNLDFSDGVSFANHLSKITGYFVGSGYGLVSHFYNQNHDLVPQNAVSFCSIADYAVMKLCSLASPLVHTSMAQSFGLFDNENLCFDTSACQKIGIDTDFLPRVTAENETVGFYKNIPVCVAIGDNQASFLGAVSDIDSDILLNYGTGSQISFVSNYRDDLENAELRPFIDGKYLVCGAALCGGRAYAVTERFFRDYLSAAGVEADVQYDVMNGMALKELESGGVNLPEISTAFCGTRQNPLHTGSVINLCESNFTPSKIITGVLFGMANELYEMYIDAGSPKFSVLYASGNGVRKNPALQKVLYEVFGKEPVLPAINEEAAYGAAKFARICYEGNGVS